LCRHLYAGSESGGFECMFPNYVDHSNSLEPSKKPINVLIKQLHTNIEVVLKNVGITKAK
jgi:hypothetical protein